MISEVAELDLSSFFDQYVRGSEDLPMAELLSHFGLKFAEQSQDVIPYLGWEIDEHMCVTFVADNSPAAELGIKIGDKILAFAGQYVVHKNDINALNKGLKPGDKVELTYGDPDSGYVKTGYIVLREPLPTRKFVLENPDIARKERPRLLRDFLNSGK